MANFESNSDANSSAVASKAFDVNRLAVPFAKAFLFTVLISAATMAGALPIPGTPVPVTANFGFGFGRSYFDLASGH